MNPFRWDCLGERDVCVMLAVAVLKRLLSTTHRSQLRFCRVPAALTPKFLPLKHAHAFGKWEQPVSEVNQSNRTSRIFLLQTHAYAFGKWGQMVSEGNQKIPKCMCRIEHFASET